jgi:hypothetical protein
MKAKVVQKEPIEMVGIKRVEIIVAERNKVWVNVDGRCIFRAAFVDEVLIFDKRISKKGADV